MNSVAFWKLEALSDRQLLDGLGAVLGSGRRLVAELVAHLGEVEERRLHLEAACSSMFSYCVQRLGLSEDEACRRIEVARLARRCPAMFPLLATGQLSLSAAALLKPHLSAESQLDVVEQLDLLDAVSGKSVQQARAVLAARFPRPDVPSSLRKLPERRAARPTFEVSRGLAQGVPSRAPALVAAPSLATPADTATTARAENPGGTVSNTSPPNGLFPPSSPQSSSSAQVTPVPGTAPEGSDTATSTSQPCMGSRSQTQGSRASRIEPLAVQRYKVQFTADAELKGKLELTRDLMRHAHPSGDFAHIIGRALDLLIGDLMKRRFGARAPRKAPATATRSVMSNSFETENPSTMARPSETHILYDTENPSDPARAPVTTSDSAGTTPSNNAQATGSTSDSAGTTPSDSVLRTSRTATSRYIGRAVRRSVLERDGLRCSWVDAGGAHCDSQAWLEHDHRQPRGKGGGAEPDNLRLLCRAHNSLAAEREYGRAHMELAVAQKRWGRAQSSGRFQRPPQT